MENAVRNFNKQFLFEPEIINADTLPGGAAGGYKHYILAGMGGSHLAAGIMKTYAPGIELYVHRDYGLPPFDEAFLKDSLCIANSYSGNTEETVDFAEEAYSRGFDVLVVTTGGTLLEFAQKNNLPHILIPATGIQPRAALGYELMALAKILGRDDCAAEARALADALDPESYKAAGGDLAASLAGKVPVVYASSRNLTLAYNWKIKFNETGKIPAFYNILPEANHNELIGFSLTDETRALGEPFHFIFLKDKNDHPQIQKRMEITEQIYESRGLPVTTLFVEGNGALERIFGSLLTVDWAAIVIARANNQDPEQVPIIEELKSRLI